MKPSIVSVNVGVATPTEHSTAGMTGIDKRPVGGAVEIRDPGDKGVGGSGLAGDAVCDLDSHGGHDQAVYAYAREDLDAWEPNLGRALPSGVFGENLTTKGLDLAASLVGERWRVGPTCVLQVSSPRIPCRTFAAWLQEQQWVRRFTERGATGVYLRVLVPGSVRAGDSVVVDRPRHNVRIDLMFRALTTDKTLLPLLLEAGTDLPEDTRDFVLNRQRVLG